MASNFAPIGSLTTLPHVIMFLCFSGIAIYNILELIVTIFMTFKRRATLYFFSVVVATFGVLLYAVAVLLLVLELINTYISTSLVNVGWTCMVTGQSLVLYSRLHLLVRDPWQLKMILAIIIVDGIIFHSIMFGLSLKASYLLTSMPCFVWADFLTGR
ncbi:hypothetical protein L207DRAFT_586133 [Hyaloscypha variabilis F]|uniref:DUF7703 domain-containing protein n=1 Tax=Hyaloscypha variabilis (strain UAMH 11265 / GT02V1 / F) TaxID=1149755 RepID=A0A2J6RGZ4_HYAVF|nr:hypothetical protein L207DRAFT_586133 [Hyaloscypha variabilis F]